MARPPPHPYPDLNTHPTSGLGDLNWAFYEPNVTSVQSGHFGPDGCGFGAQILIFWSDLQTALQRLLGYCTRVGTYPTDPAAPGYLTRKLPWRFPWANQMWVKAITEVKGVRMEGTNLLDPEDLFTVLGTAGAGDYTVNSGPWTEFRLALLTLQFWRPPYFVRTDQDIQAVDPYSNTGAMYQQEWLRYVDKNWSSNAQMLSREGSTFLFTPGQGSAGPPPTGPATGAYFQGSVGQPVSHDRVSRTWYQVPEWAIFKTTSDRTPNGLPQNFKYTQHNTKNPITGYTYKAGQPFALTVNSPIGGSDSDADPAKQFFGCPIGTLRFDSFELHPSPLQLPPILMEIPYFANMEPVSQVQYDVTFHFDLFDPPRADTLLANLIFKERYRGHNLMPFSADGMWYAVQSQVGVPGTGPPPVPTTPFQYADFSDLFRVL